MILDGDDDDDDGDNSAGIGVGKHTEDLGLLLFNTHGVLFSRV